MPLDIYIDQSVFSTAARAGDWRRMHELGTVVLPLVESGVVRVRPSQAHYTETLIHVDVDEAAGCRLLQTPRQTERLAIADAIVVLRPRRATADVGGPDQRIARTVAKAIGQTVAVCSTVAELRRALKRLPKG